MTDKVELEWRLGDRNVRWRHGSSVVAKHFDTEVGSAVALRSGSGVAVVGPRTADGHNAVVFNADGSERFRVPPPQPQRHVTFQQMYYVGPELTAIAITRGNDWATVVDEETGQVLRTYETR